MIKKKKPMAARGKTTRKGKVVKALKSVFTGVKPKVSPRTKAKRLQALAEKMKAQMGKKSGGKMTPEQLKKIMGMKPFPFVGTKSPAGMKPVLDSQGKPVKNLFQKDNRPKRRIMRRKAMQAAIPKGKMKRPKK